VRGVRLRPTAVSRAPEHAIEQLVRYLIVGGCGYVLAMALYAGGLAIGVPAYPAVAIVFVLNGAFNFTLFRLWAFPASRRGVDSELRRFCVVALGSLAVNYASFALLYSAAGMPAVPAQALAIVIATPVGFLANRQWSFRAGADGPRQ
jgi:putative flippase GtrA